MRKMIYFLLFSVIVGGTMFSCEKEGAVPQSMTVDKNAVWVTPNGKVIPYSERANWKEYVRENFSETKIDDRKIGSQPCTTETISCGLKCVVNKSTNDCSKVSECAPCMNCGCTPHDGSGGQ